MERLKFEKQFKNQLDKREIIPSEESWNKLEGLLQDDKKPVTNKFWYFGIAAACIAGILILSLVFKNNEVKTEPQIVDNPTEKAEQKLDEKPQILEPFENGVASENNAEELKNTSKDENHKPENTSGMVAEVHKKTVEKVSERKIEIQDISRIKLAEVLKNDADLKEQLLAENMNSVLAEISLAQAGSNSVTDAEIDSLLQQAATRIVQEKKYEFASSKVDANALLRDVEMEMDNSFKEKIFDILKEGFVKARTAVANRNN